MAAEIICVGTELLLGDIVNSNTQFLGQELAKLGIPHYYQSAVGDNIGRIHELLAIAVERSSILLFTGGLGPTPDDLTTEAIASFFKTELVEKQEIIDDIAGKFARLGRTMAPNNRKQALIPQGADILPNPVGTAPGMIWQPKPGLSILTFPGVPREMKHMWHETAVPYLKSIGWGKEIIHSRTLRFRGIGESSLANKIPQFFDLTNPTVAPYASKGEVRVRISAKATSETAATELITPVAEEIIEIAGLDYFGSNDDTLASVVGNLLREAGENLAVAESCTGGSVGSMLTSIPGSSDYFAGGIISYSNEVKVSLLGVKEADLIEYGAVSDVVAKQMALGVKQKLATDWGIGITGIAGPGGGTETKPVGLVYIGLAAPDGTVISQKYLLGKERGRELVRNYSACHALDLLRRKLLV